MSVVQAGLRFVKGLAKVFVARNSRQEALEWLNSIGSLRQRLPEYAECHGSVSVSLFGLEFCRLSVRVAECSSRDEALNAGCSTGESASDGIARAGDRRSEEDTE